MKKISRLKHQVKSNMYYIFWGAATAAVIAGQIYIGVGYRMMTQSVIDLTEVFTLIREGNELRRYPNVYYCHSDPLRLHLDILVGSLVPVLKWISLLLI